MVKYIIKMTHDKNNKKRIEIDVKMEKARNTLSSKLVSRSTFLKTNHDKMLKECPGTSL